MKNISKYILLLAAVALWSCEPKMDDFSPSNGSADFTKFVAVGDSYTAGYTDGALGRRGQEESFSAILGKQLMYVGSSSYNQPMVLSDESIGTTVIDAQGTLNGYFELKLTESGLAPMPSVGDKDILDERVYSTENQNFGIPGAKLIHLGELPDGYPSYAVLNDFYARFASSTDATVIGDALAAQPTFVSLWIGNNDVLGYALEGGEVDEITNPLIFDGALKAMVNMITSSGAKVVLGNIPAIETIPYFNYILKDGHIGFVIEDELSPVGYRILAEGEKVLLSASTAIGMGYGLSTEMPLPAKYVLDADELDAIEYATAEYNKTIASLDNDNVAVVDLFSIMNQLNSTGLIIDGNYYTTEFITGGVFSLDGIHASGRGSAIIANAFIEAINAEYNASVPLANVNDYDMVEFP